MKKIEITIDEKTCEFSLSEIGEEVLRESLPGIRQQNNYPPDISDEKVISTIMENQLKSFIRSIIPL